MVPIIPIIPKIPVNRNGKPDLHLNFSFAIPKIPVIDYFRSEQNCMQIDHLDYIKLVVADFKKKQGDSERPFLSTFTRSIIRQECLNVYTERLRTGKRRETNTLRCFFGSPDADGDFTSRIEFFPLDKFRPLENIMRGRIQNPLQANVELLAWLIDFRHRPYATGMNVVLNEEEMAILNMPTIEPVDVETSTIEREGSKTKN